MTLTPIQCILYCCEGMETSLTGSKALTVNKALTGSKVHTDSSLKEDNPGDLMEVHQEVMDGVMRVRSACNDVRVLL